MTPGDLSAHPTTPLRLYLTSGNTVHVNAPGLTSIRGSLLYVNGTADDRLTVERRSKVIAIDHVEMAEPRVPHGPGTLPADGGPP